MEQDNNSELTSIQENETMSSTTLATEEIVLMNVSALPIAVQQRLEVVQMLQQLRGSDGYSQIQRLGAKKLGMSVRSLQRLVRAYTHKGIEGLKRQTRVDKGEPKTDQQWREFIVKIYRAGNKGGTRMSRAQVAVRVAARAMELGMSEYPIQKNPLSPVCWYSRSRLREACVSQTRAGLQVNHYGDRASHWQWQLGVAVVVGCETEDGEARRRASSIGASQAIGLVEMYGGDQRT